MNDSRLTITSTANSQTIHFGKRRHPPAPSSKCPSCQKADLDADDRCTFCKQRFLRHPIKDLIPLGTPMNRRVVTETMKKVQVDLKNALALIAAIDQTRLMNNNSNNLPPVSHESDKNAKASVTPAMVDLVGGQREQRKIDATTEQSACPPPPANVNVSVTPFDENAEISIACRSIHFGSYRRASYKSGFVIYESGVRLLMKEGLEDPKPLALNISWRHFAKVEYILTSQTLAVFLLVREYCARKIRKTLNMKETDLGGDDRTPYFNPDSDNLDHKYITILLSSRTNDWVPNLRKYVQNAEVVHKVQIEVVELLFTETRSLLAATAAQSIEQVFNRRMTSDKINNNEVDDTTPPRKRRHSYCLRSAKR